MNDALKLPPGFKLIDKAKPPQGFNLIDQPKKPDHLSLPEFGTIDGNNALFGGQMGDENNPTNAIVRDAVAGLFTLNPKARVDGIEKRFPNLQVERIGDGDNAVITNPETGGKAVVNAGGLSNQDIAPFIGLGIAQFPAASVATGAKTAFGAFAKGAATEGAVDLGLQAGEILQGSEQGIDGGRTALASGLGGAGNSILNKILSSRQAVRTAVESTPDDVKVVKYLQTGKGKIAKDSVAKVAIRQGFDEGVVAAIKGASPADRKRMLASLERLEKGRKNAVYRAKYRPSDVVGDALVSRLNVVRETNRTAAKLLDGVARSLKGKPVDIRQPINTFIESLDEIGVKLRYDGKEIKAVFDNSDIEGVVGAESFINKIIKRISNTRTPDAYDVHRVKRYIDESVSYGKRVEGLGGKADSIVKELRRNLDGVLDKQFSRYDKVNSVYSSTKEAMDVFQKASGASIDLTSKNTAKALGVLARRLVSNAQSRVKIMDAVEMLESTALKHKKNAFNDDLMTQVVFVDELERVFGSSASASFLGQIERGAGQLAADVAMGGKAGVVPTAIKYGKDKVFSISPENQIEVMKRLLSR